jgi:hypothetical protein
MRYDARVTNPRKISMNAQICATSKQTVRAPGQFFRAARSVVRPSASRWSDQDTCPSLRSRLIDFFDGGNFLRPTREHANEAGNRPSKSRRLVALGKKLEYLGHVRRLPNVGKRLSELAGKKK